ncbi:MAG: class I SAM-dependent methyltransferase [Desulfobulbaceae bacterium]|uniref:Ribosomal RNA small subunit methyltransferase J n=1 Tax=Candidatus Desulfatifera sulfidica TaxID=2841691 RepID=A0A8J6T9R3_9BACT|nr:class I SAM-dependent methyltransferase [Candidatus Desulfatifera sulfidica]
MSPEQSLTLSHRVPHVSWLPPDNNTLHQQAAALADTLGTTCVHQQQLPAGLTLLYTNSGLELQEREPQKGKISGRLHVNFLSAPLRYRLRHGGGIRQPLARAVGIKPGHRPTIVDATAGLGIDGFILASLGCKVTLIERSLILAALLKDGLNRAEDNPICKTIINRISLQSGNAIDLLDQLHISPETIYLDPMYPERDKAALNKQEMRLIRTLVGDDHDSELLLDTALTIASERVVVKRPKRAPQLTLTRPTHSIHMKNSRFDVYLIR